MSMTKSGWDSQLPLRTDGQFRVIPQYIWVLLVRYSRVAVTTTL